MSVLCNHAEGADLRRVASQREEGFRQMRTVDELLAVKLAEIRLTRLDGERYVWGAEHILHATVCRKC